MHLDRARLGERVRSPGQPPRQPVQRRFADDAERDAVILSAQDIRVAQEAITLARDDRAAGRGPAGDELADPDQPRSMPDQPRAAPDQQHQAHDQSHAAPDQPTRPPGRTADQPPTAASTPPSWGTVLATTIRLWWQRHGRPGAASPRWRVIAVVLLVAVVLAWAALSLALTRGNGRTGSSAPNGGNGSDTSRQAAARPRSRRPRRPGRRPRRGWSSRPPRMPSCPATRRCARRAQQAGLPLAGCRCWAPAHPGR